MKAISVALLLSVTLTLTAAEVRLGGTLEEVRATLGTPKGQVRVGDRHLLYYDRGEVELQAGIVSRVALLSVEDLAAREAWRAAEAARVRAEQEARRPLLLAEGEAVKARKLADPSFLTAPLAYQVAFWQDFSRRYPDVPCAEQLAGARLRLAGQLEQRRIQAEQAERLAELEARVREAEARAAEAEYASQTMASYPSYLRSGYNRHHSMTGWPVQYPVSVNTWQSFVTPPVVPHMRFNERHGHEGHWSDRDGDHNSNDNWRGRRGRDHSFDSGVRPFAWPNRL